MAGFSALGLMLWLLGLHFLCYMGLGRVFPLESRMVSYPQHFVEMFTTPTLSDLIPALWMTCLYMTLATIFACVLVFVLRLLPMGLLQILGSLPAFIALLFMVFGMIQMTRHWDFGIWLDGNHLLMQVMIGLALALPIAARASGILKQKSAELEQAQFSVVARSLGLAEPRVRFKAFRVALPESSMVLVGEALGLVASLMLIEGMLSLPGIGRAAFTAFEGVSGGVGGTVAEDVKTAVNQASASLLLLFVVAAVFSGIFITIQKRLDPRLQA